MSDEGKALVQMYQAGYLDAIQRYNGQLTAKKDWKEFNANCKKDFELRFMNKIAKQLKKVKKK